MADQQVVTSWDPRNRIDEELEFFTELALQETERWIQVVTRLRFKYPEDPRKSLENGVLLLELLNNLKPGCVRKINRFPGPIAGLDNINVFLDTCQKHFGLKDSQLFNTCDLEDLEVRGIFETDEELKYETERRLRNVAITLFWLGKSIRSWHDGAQLDLTAFTDLLGTSAASHVSSPREPVSANNSFEQQPTVKHSVPAEPAEPAKTPQRADDSLDYTEEELEDILAARDLIRQVGQNHSRQESGDSLAHSSGFSSSHSDSRTGGGQQSSHGDVIQHARNDSYDSFISQSTNRSSTQDTSLADDEGSEFSMPVRAGDAPGAHIHHTTSNKPYSATLDTCYDNQDNNAKGDHQFVRSKNDPISPQEEYDRFRFGDAVSPDSTTTTMNNSETALPTRVAGRRVSQTAANPMQFVSSGSNPLAEKARETLDEMNKQKEEKQKKTVVQETNEEEDWQSNLSNWRSRRKSASKEVYQRAVLAEELEKEKEKEQEDLGRRKSKTWREMQENRQRRKSGGYNIYPFGQEDDEDAVSPRDTRHQDDALAAFGFTRADDLKPKKEQKSKRGEAQQDYPAFTSLERAKPAPVSTTRNQGDTHSSRLAVSKLKGASSPELNGQRVTTHSSDKEYQVERLQKLSVVTKTKDGHRAWSWQRSVSSVDDEEKEEIAPWAQQSPTTQRKDTAITQQSNNYDASEDSVFTTNTTSSYSYSREQRSSKNVSPKVETNSEFSAAKTVFNKKESSLNNDVQKPASSTAPRRVGTTASPYNDTSPNQTKKPLPWERSSPTRMDWTPEKVKPANSEPEVKKKPVSQVAVGSRSPRQEQKHFIEKTIKIGQKPNHPKGFGFNIKGGKEHGTPITVAKVVLGGAADVCELMPNDELISINGAELANHYQDSVQLAINTAARAGQIELRIRRSFEKGKFEDESFSDLEEEVQPRRSAPPVEKIENNGFNHKSELLSTLDSPSVNGRAEIFLSQTCSYQEIPDPEPAPEPEMERSQVVWDRTLHVQSSTPSSYSNTSFSSNHSTSQRTTHVFHVKPFKLTTEVTPRVEPPREPSPEPEPEVEEDEPPPLPAAPPPVPNWGTFPGEAPAPPIADPYMDNSDLVPENSAQQSQGNYQTDTITRIRTDILRKKSEFLGLNVDKSEEFHAFREEKEKEREAKTKEDTEWNRVDKRESTPESSILEQLRRDAEQRERDAATRETRKSSWDSGTGTGAYSHRSEFDLEQQEREIIENLEREERERQMIEDEERRKRLESQQKFEEEEKIRRQIEEEQSREAELLRREEERRVQEEEERWKKQQEQEKMRAWKSMEFLKQPYTSSVLDINGDAPGSRDMESMMMSRPKPDIQSSRRFFNLEEERQKMESWESKQNRKRQDQPNQYSYGANNHRSEEQFDRDQERLDNQMQEDMLRAKKAEEEKKKESQAKTDNNMNVIPGEVDSPALQKTLWQFVEQPSAKEYNYKWDGMDLLMSRDLVLNLPQLVKPKYNQYDHMNFSNYYKKLSRNLTRLASAGRESPTPPPGPEKVSDRKSVDPKPERAKLTHSLSDSDATTLYGKPKRRGIDGPIPFSLFKQRGGKPHHQKLSFRPGSYQSSSLSGEMSDTSSSVGISSSSSNSDISEVAAVNRHLQQHQQQPRGADFPCAISPTPILVDVADQDMDAMVMKNSPGGGGGGGGGRKMPADPYVDCSADDESTIDLKELEKQRGSSPENFTCDLIDLGQLDMETEDYLRRDPGGNDSCDSVQINDEGGNLWSQIINGLRDDQDECEEAELCGVIEKEQKLLEKDIAKQKELEEVRRQREEFRRQEEQADEDRRQRRLAQQKEAQSSFPWNAADEWQRQDPDVVRREQERILEERERERERQEQQDRKRQQEIKRKEEEMKIKEENDRQREREREKEERRLRDEETMRADELRRAKESADAALRQKEEELKKMEERILMEAEQLKRERERLERDRSMTPSGPAYTVGRVGGEHASPTAAGEVQLSYVRSDTQVMYADHKQSPDRPSFQVEVKTQGVKEPPPLPRQPPPVGRKPPKKEPAIQPKPSIKAELASSRREILDLNKRPGASRSESPRFEPAPGPIHVRTGSQDVNLSRTVVERRQAVSADDPVRRSWHESVPAPSPRSEAPGYHSPQSSPGGSNPVIVHAQMSKKTLHSLNQVPRSKVVSNNAWVREEVGQPQSRSQIMRQNVQSSSQHWLVEEAERRRIASHTGQTRPDTLAARSQPAPAQQGAASDLYDSMYPEQREGQRYDLSHDGKDYIQRSYSNSPRTPQQPSPAAPHMQISHSPSPARTPTHVADVERPENYQRSPRPLPDSVKQTLIERVNHAPRSPGYSANPAHSYQPSPHYSSPMSTFKGPFPEQSPVRYDQAVPYTGQHQLGGGGGQQSSSHHQVYHERTVSAQSASSYASSHERAPPVPPKPPRLLSSSSEESHADHVASVSGAQGCAHCEEELGHGAAMVIESLGLFYHVACFRCCVCQAQLGNGIQGADVRIRGNKLHCHNCYSNDEVGLKYSRV